MCDTPHTHALNAEFIFFFAEFINCKRLARGVAFNFPQIISCAERGKICMEPSVLFQKLLFSVVKKITVPRIFLSLLENEDSFYRYKELPDETM
jgi:hypothetical protein